ncbi:MAG: hypothetical protein ACKV22_18415 [Bryobacteraceae bacterium]
MMRFAAFGLTCALLAGAQNDRVPDPSAREEKTARLPNGRLQSEEILKAEHEKSLADVAKLIKLAEDLQDELTKNDRHVLSLSALKKCDEIEKLAKKLKGRIRK